MLRTLGRSASTGNWHSMAAPKNDCRSLPGTWPHLGQRLQSELVIERVKRHRQTGAVWGNARLMAHVIADAGTPHAKHGVCVQIGIALHKHMCDETIIALSVNHDM